MTTEPALPTAACPDHRALVAAALDEAADDATLERYALEVPACPACQRALAGRLSVHPALLDRAGRGGLDELAAVMGSDLAAMSDEGFERVRPPSRAPWLALAAATLAMAAAAAWWVTTGSVGTVPAPPSVTPPPPQIARQAPVLPPPAPPLAAPAPRIDMPRRPVAAAVPPPVAPPPTTEDDAVAEVDPVGEADWPPPPYEDLVGGAAKAVGAVRAVQLVVGGAPRVGGTVSLATVASAPMELQVCVEGPERGVVWRGRVPGGRTALTRAQRPVSFAFAAPGVYRFVAGADPTVAGCAPPVHVVEVEVAP